MNRQQSDTAVLGALTFAPATGYAVRAGIRDVLGQFWSESVGQIYPTLTRLLAEGMVAASPGSRSGSSQYAIPPAGRWRLGELLREPIRTAPPRNGLLLRLFFGRQLGAAECARLVEQARATALARLEALAATRAEVEAEDTPDRDYILLTVSAGEHTARATIAWADEALDSLATMPALPASDEQGQPQ